MTDPKPLPLEDEVLRRMLKTPPNPKTKPAPTPPKGGEKAPRLTIARSSFNQRIVDADGKPLDWT